MLVKESSNMKGESDHLETCFIKWGWGTCEGILNIEGCLDITLKP